MSESRVELHDLPSEIVPSPVPYAVLLPPGYDAGGPFPLCLSLHGGGGSRDQLEASKPLYDAAWAKGDLPPVVFAAPSTAPMGFYLDAADGSVRWETFVAEEFLGHLRARFDVGRDRESTLVMGTSMGGYGSLKIAFRRPSTFHAVAAMEPAVFPAQHVDELAGRGSWWFGVGPQALVRAGQAAFARENPANLAAANADALRSGDLAIYLEVGDADLLTLHDGTEYLHRTLWDLDIPHEYRLVLGGDHVGPSLAGRQLDALRFIGSTLAPQELSDSPEFTPAERDWMEWMANGAEGEPPEIDMSTEAGIRMLRTQFAEARTAAAAEDPTMARRYGRIPPIR